MIPTVTSEGSFIARRERSPCSQSVRVGTPTDGALNLFSKDRGCSEFRARFASERDWSGQRILRVVAVGAEPLARTLERSIVHKEQRKDDVESPRLEVDAISVACVEGAREVVDCRAVTTSRSDADRAVASIAVAASRVTR